ncbi:MAG: biotin/lipoyl-binding protein [Deltaproteobacteria bacterium]|nr:biotin/lipoyl-binding protein [Deltaproteobacteria bacterium]
MLFRRSLLLSLVLLAACGDEDDGVQMQSAALEIESSIEDDILASSQETVPGAPDGAPVYLGLVEPLRVADVSFEVPGKVRGVFVTVGESVKKGQVLAELETESRQAKLKETYKKLGDARSQVRGKSRASADAPPPQWMVDEAKRLQADADARNARATGDRGSFKRTARTQGEEAAVERALAINARHTRGRKVSTRQARRASEDALSLALVDDLEQRVRTLENAIDNSQLKSPMNGLVVNVTALQGVEWNTRSVDSAFSMVDPASFIVQIVIPKKRADRLVEKELAWVELPELGGTGRKVIRARWQSVGEESSQLAGGSAWVNAVFQLPKSLPRRVHMGEEVRVVLQP